VYSIGNVIVGTYLPWDDETVRRLSVLYATQESIDRLELYCTLEDLRADADNGDFTEWMDGEPWRTEYHGSAPSEVAWVGAKIGEIDDTDHFPLSDLTGLQPTPEQLAKAREAYESLPPAVREALPPFGTYVVWSSS